MAVVSIPIPSLDFDASQTAVSWLMLTQAGHRVEFATPNGAPGAADKLMLTGLGLGPWARLPVIGEVRPIGAILGAD